MLWSSGRRRPIWICTSPSSLSSSPVSASPWSASDANTSVAASARSSRASKQSEPSVARILLRTLFSVCTSSSSVACSYGSVLSPMYTRSTDHTSESVVEIASSMSASVAAFVSTKYRYLDSTKSTARLRDSASTASNSSSL
eukprot:Amastigsp_a510255_4.p4 type:complete len:142 gc:universal Amastigsp_a510255_4:528-103(-)